MARRKSYVDRRQSDGHERWLISYADFITLMFAVFVMLYAISSLNEAKYKGLSESLGKAFGGQEDARGGADSGSGGPGSGGGGKASGRIGTARAAALHKAAQDLAAALAPLIAHGDAHVVESPRGVAVELNAGALFAAGDATLQPAFRKTVTGIAQVLARTDLAIQVSGHTDDTAISTAQFPTNWELSTARASSVVRALAEGGVDPRRLSAQGYAEYQPLESNATPDGRARNRRVVLSVLANDPEKDAPAEVTPGTAAADDAGDEAGDAPAADGKKAAAAGDDGKP